MAYGKYHIAFNPLETLKYKVLRTLVRSSPLNVIRVWALRRCGFRVGSKVYIANGLTISMFNAKTNCGLSIGDRVAVAPNVIFVLASDANWSKLNAIMPPIEGSITIEDDCWIGAGAILLPDIRIGAMSVVAAGAVVTKDVEARSIVAGVPARKISSVDAQKNN